MNHVVGAWKLRAIVYGMLLAVGVLVWVARPSTPARAREEPLVTFRGKTAQRAQVDVGMQGKHLRNLFVSGFDSNCGTLVYWYAVAGLSGTSYRELGDRIELTRSWDDADASMHARLSGGGHKIEGTVAFAWHRCHGRAAPSVRFSASG
jgi:hypothetical protein